MITVSWCTWISPSSDSITGVPKEKKKCIITRVFCAGDLLTPLYFCWFLFYDKPISDDSDEEEDNGRATRTRGSQRRSSNGRSSRSVRKSGASKPGGGERGGSSTPNGSHGRQPNGKPNGHGRRRKAGSDDYDEDGDFEVLNGDEDEDDDLSGDQDDGDWGSKKSRNNNHHHHGNQNGTNRRSRARRSGTRHSNGEAHGEYLVGTEDDEDEDMQEYKHEKPFSSTSSSPNRLTRNRRKKTRIIDSDDDFVS